MDLSGNARRRKGTTMNIDLETGLESVLADQGLQGGLAWLNARVSHRFTAVYRVDGEVLRIVGIVDKLGKEPIPRLHEIPLDLSLCQYSIRDGSFVSNDTGADRRLDGNPYQDLFGSYVGISLDKTPGITGFTFCHYDLVTHELPSGEFDFLMQAVHLLPPYARLARRSAG